MRRLRPRVLCNVLKVIQLISDRNNAETKSGTYFYKYKKLNPKILSHFFKRVLVGGRTRNKVWVTSRLSQIYSGLKERVPMEAT